MLVAKFVVKVCEERAWIKSEDATRDDVFLRSQLATTSLVGQLMSRARLACFAKIDMRARVCV